MTSLVLHAFAPLDGPAAPTALHQLQALWTACGEVLGMDTPVSGLPVVPSDWRGARRVGALAARERGGFRAVLRRDRDVLILSAALPGVGDAGWVELDRWLDDVAAGGVDALIGTCRLYLMPAAAPSLPPALPAFETHAGWQNDRIRLGARAHAWELSPRQDTRRERRLIVAGTDLDALTWGSPGDDRLPPLGRYLMHAAVLRYHYRIRTGDQRRIGSLRDAGPGRDLLRADFARLHSMHAASAASLEALLEAAGEAGMRGDGGPDPVTDDGQFGRWLTRQLEDARSGLENLLRADGVAGRELFAPLPPSPAAEAGSGARASHAAAHPIGSARSRRTPAFDHAAMPARQTETAAPGHQTETAAPGHQAKAVAPGWQAETGEAGWRTAPVEAERSGPPGPQTGPVHPGPLTAPPSTPEWRAVPAPRAPGTRHALRMSFTVDAVGYSGNDAKGREIMQQRISDVVGEALGDLHLSLADTDHQGTGDGVNVVLPADLDLPRTLAQLLHGTRAALRAERRRYADPLRLRMGVSIGTFRVAALGWSDGTVIETSRLCDSDPLRDVMKDHPDLLFAAMISDRLYPFTVDEGHPALLTTDFTAIEVTVKSYRSRAWLWLPKTG